MICPQCKAVINVGYVCDVVCGDPLCGTCFDLTPCGQGMHEEGCETMVLEDDEDDEDAI